MIFYMPQTVFSESLLSRLWFTNGCLGMRLWASAVVCLHNWVIRTHRHQPIGRRRMSPLSLGSKLACVHDILFIHDDVIKWKHFPRNWSFVREIHRSPVNAPHIGQWRGALMFSVICVWINDWVNNREAGDLRGYRAHSDVIVMWI